MIRRPPRSTQSRSSAASDVYKRQELNVGKPQVVTRMVDGKLHEPMEHMTIDVPEEHLGAITQLLASRRGRMESMANHGTGWVRMEFIVPARGLIGFRSTFLTDTRGTGIASSISHGFEPWAGPIAVSYTHLRAHETDS